MGMGNSVPSQAFHPPNANGQTYDQHYGNQAPKKRSGFADMLPDSLRAMLPEGFEAALNDALQGSSQDDPNNQFKGKGKGKGLPNDQFQSTDSFSIDGYPTCKGKGKQGSMDQFQPVDSFFIDNSPDCKGKGKGKRGHKDSFYSNESMYGTEPSFAGSSIAGSFAMNGYGTECSMDGPSHSKGKGGKGKAKGKGKDYGCDSFATTRPQAGSFATRPPNSMSFTNDVLNSRHSFAPQWSDESFAMGLPPSAARGQSGKGQARMPAGVSFVAGPREGYDTRMPDNYFADGSYEGFNTGPPHEGMNTHLPQGYSFPSQLQSAGSFADMQHLAPHSSRRPNPQGNWMGMIQE